ncbi:MAG TPA: hypothetical protein VFS43_19700 [Polyangiaceae bacterium]|nr:hypothetical protein [Polyangiaceae bacterium]
MPATTPDARSPVAFALEQGGARMTAVESSGAALAELGRASFDALASAQARARA